jgi:hypothetical protein
MRGRSNTRIMPTALGAYAPEAEAHVSTLGPTQRNQGRAGERVPCHQGIDVREYSGAHKHWGTCPSLSVCSPMLTGSVAPPHGRCMSRAAVGVG